MAHTIARAVQFDFTMPTQTWYETTSLFTEYRRAREKLMLTLWCKYLYHKHNLITMPRQWRMGEMYLHKPDAYNAVQFVTPQPEGDGDYYYIESLGGITLSHNELLVNWDYEDKIGRLNTPPDNDDMLWKVTKLRIELYDGEPDVIDRTEKQYRYLSDACIAAGIPIEFLSTAVDQRISNEERDLPTA